MIVAEGLKWVFGGLMEPRCKKREGTCGIRSFNKEFFWFICQHFVFHLEAWSNLDLFFILFILFFFGPIYNAQKGQCWTLPANLKQFTIIDFWIIIHILHNFQLWFRFARMKRTQKKKENFNPDPSVMIKSYYYYSMQMQLS